MGLWKFLKRHYHQAAIIIMLRDIFKLQSEKMVFIENISDLTGIAERVVDYAWQFWPDVLNGEFGAIPQDIAICVYALGISLGAAEHKFTYEERRLCFYTLRSLLYEVEINEPFYNFSKTDNHLIRTGVNIGIKSMAEITSHRPEDVRY